MTQSNEVPFGAVAQDVVVIAVMGVSQQLDTYVELLSDWQSDHMEC
jgi:hypothetical protein